MLEKVEFIINPKISADELFEFYSDNDICEEGYGKDVAARVLQYSSLIVGAYLNGKLIGTTRAMFDGTTADLVEFCLARDYQGPGLEYDNGSIVEKDKYGIGAELCKITIRRLIDMGAYFVSAIAFEEVEKDVLIDIGFERNDGHVNYVIDMRPYVPEERRSKFV